jgi:hypothetical protein
MDADAVTVQTVITGMVVIRPDFDRPPAGDPEQPLAQMESQHHV